MRNLSARPERGDESDSTPRATRSSRRHRGLLAALVGATLVVAACGASATPTSTPSSPGSATPALAQVVGATGSATSTSNQIANNGALQQLQQEYEAVVQQVAPSVVVIETSSGLGSGIVLDTKGDIVTNAHVVGDATTFTVTLADGRQFKGTLVGTFAANDIAVVRINAPNLQPATFADSSKLQVGEVVMAVGNPLGLQTSVTQGIVSALGRTVTEPGGVTLPGTIQTSAAINPGNSGGALVDINGDVIGIPTLAAVDQQIGGSAPGIGFAIPSNDARDFASQLISSGHVTSSHRAYLGIQSANVLGTPGVLVYGVASGGPAAQAGITTQELIVSVDGKATPDTSALSVVLAGLQPGQKVAVVIEHANGNRSTVQVTLGQIPG